MPSGETPSQVYGQPRVGDTFAASGRPLTEEELESFLIQVGDFHPVHADAEQAAASSFGERIAPGTLTLAYTLGLLPFDPDRIQVLRRISDVVFTRPVTIGDTLSIAGRVTAVVPGERGVSMVSLTLKTMNQHEELVCRSRVQVSWKGEDRPATSGGEGRDGA